MSEPRGDEVVAFGHCLLERPSDRLRIVRVGTHGSLPARLVHRRMRRCDDRCTAGHRLDDRHPEALESRGVRRDRCPSVERRQLGVRDVAQPAHARVVEQRLLAPARAPDDGEQRVAGEHSVGFGERLQVLARLERRHRDDVGRAEVCHIAVGGENLLDTRWRNPDPLRWHEE